MRVRGKNTSFLRGGLLVNKCAHELCQGGGKQFVNCDHCSVCTFRHPIERYSGGELSDGAGDYRSVVEG